MSSLSQRRIASVSTQEKIARIGDLLTTMDSSSSLHDSVGHLVEERLAETETLFVLDRASRELRAQLENGHCFLAHSAKLSAC